ncbi:hypothetical protein BK133_11245 [Paenibacillus sp. FSL H8-0548]|nr:hypothetical protein BK133_11245 [Paenibacillus sp. FSL H8-0548]
MNQMVKVKLDPTGVEIMRKRHDDLHNRVMARNGKGIDPFKLKLDDEGFTPFVAWEFIQIFGEHVSIGFQPPFDINIKLICD